jgi:hypothetical protein
MKNEDKKAIRVLMPIHRPEVSKVSKEIFEAITKAMDKDDDCVGVNVAPSDDHSIVAITIIWKNTSEDEIKKILAKIFIAYEDSSGIKIGARIGRIPNLLANVDPDGPGYVDYTFRPSDLN